MRTSLLIALLIVSYPAAAQDDGPPPPKRPATADVTTQVLALKFAHAPATADVISKLGLPMRIVADARTNVLIITGAPDTILRAQELVMDLDQKIDTKSHSQVETMIIPLKHRAVRTVTDSVRLVLSSGGDVAVDTERNTLVIRGGASEVQAVQRLITAIDVPQRSLFGSFFLLGKSATALPDTPHYAKVRGQLTRLGLEGYGIVARTAVRTLDGAEFSAIASVKGEGSISIKGQITGPSGGDEVQMTLQVVRGADVIGTTLKAPLGDLVIIGFTPSVGEPVVLAMRFE